MLTQNLRTTGIDDHRQLSLPVIPRLRVRNQLTHKVRNVGHVGAVWCKETAYKALMQRVLRNVAFPESVWPDRYPLRERIACPDGVMEEVYGSRVVPGRRHHTSWHPDDRLFEHSAARVEIPWVIDRDAIHEDELDRLCGLQGFDPSAQPRRGLRDEVARRPKDTLEADYVTCLLYTSPSPRD